MKSFCCGRSFNTVVLLCRSSAYFSAAVYSAVAADFAVGSAVVVSDCFFP